MALVNDRHRQQGFTLLEILVAVALLSLLMTAAFSSVHYASRSWEAGIRRVGSGDAGRAAERLLAKMIRQLRMGRYSDGGKEHLLFDGEANQLAFIAPAPEYDERFADYEYLLRFTSVDGGGELVLFYLPRLPGDHPLRIDEEAPSQVLLHGLSEFRIAYYGQHRTTDLDWVEQWRQEEPAYPQLISFSFSIEDGAPVREKIIRVRSDLQATVSIKPRSRSRRRGR